MHQNEMSTNVIIIKRSWKPKMSTDNHCIHHYC